MTKLSLKELHEIEVTHSVISFCACVTKETETCSKCGLEIYKEGLIYELKDNGTKILLCGTPPKVKVEEIEVSYQEVLKNGIIIIRD